MFEGLKSIGILIRILATLRTISTSLKDLEKTQYLQLKLQCIKYDLDIKSLESAEYAIDTEDGEVINQSEAELAKLYAMEKAYEEKFGRSPRLDEEVDIPEFAK